jgi:hypothetical protein
MKQDREQGSMNRLMRALIIVGMVAALTATAFAAAADAPKRPNIVIILADDMGFADMGSYGSEIKTPHFDSLASNGVRFTNFYTHASCSPTRSMLLSGVDTHLNGLGNMDEWIATNQRGVVGYEGYLNNRVVTLPQLLKDAGYHTYMVGKWHMGKQPDQIPAARGFERGPLVHVAQAIQVRIDTAQQNRPRGRTGRVRVEVCEAHALLRQRVEVRRLDLASERSHVGVPHVIGEDDDDIRPSRRRRVRWRRLPCLGGGGPQDAHQYGGADPARNAQRPHVTPLS